MSDLVSINLKRTVGPTKQLECDLSEQIWELNRRLAQLFPEAVDPNRVSVRVGIVHARDGILINSFENRLRVVGDLIKDPSEMLHTAEYIGFPLKLQGNMSPSRADRSICVICLEGINDITSGRTGNPLMPTALKCQHAFHIGCLSEMFASGRRNCPTCQAPFSKEDIEGIRSWIDSKRTFDPESFFGKKFSKGDASLY